MFSSFSWMNAMTTSPIVLVLVVCSIVTLGAAIERIYYFVKRRGNPDETFRKTVVRVREGRLHEATVACEASLHPFGPAGLEVIRTSDKSADAFEERLHVALSGQKLLECRHESGLVRAAHHARHGRQCYLANGGLYLFGLFEGLGQLFRIGLWRHGPVKRIHRHLSIRSSLRKIAALRCP